MAKHLLLVFTRPHPGQDAEYNEWYSDKHLDDVLRIPGFTAAQRFQVAGLMNAPDSIHQYLSIYEIEADDPTTAIAELESRGGTAVMPLSNALDAEASILFLATPLTQRVVEKATDA